MNEASRDPLSNKIEHLERSLRRWKVAVAVGGIVLAALAGMVTATFFAHQLKQTKTENVDEVTARKFVVVNQAGDPIATLGSWENGAVAGLVLLAARANRLDSKEAEKRLIRLLTSLAERGGSAFLATKDDSWILLDMRKGRGILGTLDWGTALFAGPDSAGINLKTGPDSAGKSAEISLDASYVPGFRMRKAGVSLWSPNGSVLSLAASDEVKLHKASKYVNPGEVSVTLQEPWREGSGKTPRAAEFALR